MMVTVLFLDAEFIFSHAFLYTFRFCPYLCDTRHTICGSSDTWLLYLLSVLPKPLSKKQGQGGKKVWEKT